MKNRNPLSTTAACYNESTSAERDRGATGSKIFEGSTRKEKLTRVVQERNSRAQTVKNMPESAYLTVMI